MADIIDFLSITWPLFLATICMSGAIGFYAHKDRGSSPVGDTAPSPDPLEPSPPIDSVDDLLKNLPAFAVPQYAARYREAGRTGNGHGFAVAFKVDKPIRDAETAMLMLRLHTDQLREIGVGTLTPDQIDGILKTIKTSLSSRDGFNPIDDKSR